MNVENITNKNLSTVDWAAKDRKDFLKKLQTKRVQKKVHDIVPGLSARNVWMSDVSIMDSRSVKAQLAGRGDYRVLWWNVSRFMHKVMNPSSTLENAMYAFHSRQHSLTLKKMEFTSAMSEIAEVIRKSGFIAGIQYYQSLTKRH